ncbi:DUF6183 family protein [Streptomyces sp. NPDC102467]|uniref:DUF6183 family protein n=1 Tax=Streptomyces sp. NPDC102467 TaxID=3366179 RepID=UPI0038143A32
MGIAEGDIEAWARDGDAGRVAALVGELAGQRDALDARLQDLDRRLAQALRVLALTPGRDFLDRLLLLAPRVRRAEPRLLASLVAEAHSLDDALYVIAEGGGDRRNDELRFCLFQELLLRGADPDEVRRAAGPYFVPAWQGLAWLPDRLSDIERIEEKSRASMFPSRSYNGGSHPVCSPSLAAPVPVDAAARRTGAGLRLVESASEAPLEAIAGPPTSGGWGACEAGVFRPEALEVRIEPEELPGALAALPMDCLAGLGEQARFEVGPSSAREVWQILYATASCGGMYHRGAHGAYGRLAAWWSLRALAGAAATATAAEVETAARACTWYRFEADTEWFHNEMSDYGIAALTPDGRRLAVLAATDTD